MAKKKADKPVDDGAGVQVAAAAPEPPADKPTDEATVRIADGEEVITVRLPPRNADVALGPRTDNPPMIREFRPSAKAYAALASLCADPSHPGHVHQTLNRILEGIADAD